MNNASVCRDLKQMKADLRRLVANSKDMGNQSDVHELVQQIKSITSTMDQFCVVLNTENARIISTSDCFLDYKPCPTDDSLCVYGSPQLSPLVRDEACRTHHNAGEIFMIPANEAFPGRNVSYEKFPVAYAKRDDLNSASRVARHLKNHLHSRETITPQVI